MRDTVGPPKLLVINADDFGYFDGVSRGIIEAAEIGSVTATGVMANGPALHGWVDKLRRVPGISVGVHLNATLGRPLSQEMSDYLRDRRRNFPSKGALIAALTIGRLPSDLLLHEWRTQIQHCVKLGLRLEFLNSHEHVHMFPGVYSKIWDLAGEVGIPYVRAPSTELPRRLAMEGLVRSLALALLKTLAPTNNPPQPRLIGVSASGRLDTPYCRWRFPRLAPGGAYELMCHPGSKDPVAGMDKRLSSYHDWEGELSLLTSREFADILRTNNVSVSSFSNLPRLSANGYQDRTQG